ncbi:putative nucleic-acid-binding protein [Neisseria sp. HSC-16F19]|nr:type II toxin-antitoxin system VapC family toxin [Neisseria sp. HSC-16F19]MCP2040951.1 putative nucleic-acid-binding protein [Neisseria sp. HSC-16F19]
MSTVAVDTHVLVRLFVDDDPAQQQAAIALLDSADAVAIPTTVLMETVWVLHRGYRIPKADILALLQNFLAFIPNLLVQSNEIDAGLALLAAKGDFADGVHAFNGGMLGARRFATFDRRATTLLQQNGVDALLLTATLVE